MIIKGLVILIIVLGVLKIGWDSKGYEPGWLDKDK